ncbi:MAG: UvrD-helicase domain-containing protein, partial [Candidatus Magnetomorum sp.]|nr:UvrD-helicase domain-containing protein [Candidatus Magnetomorum sp.]
MKYVADFHIHSHYSRATAKNLDLEHIYQAAQIKGITVVGTGDFTHPGWISEISEKLEPAENGLYALKSEFAKPVDAKIPPLCKGPVRFILTSEISSIYKKNDRTRKNHNLLFMPDIDSVQALNARLDSIGNIHSDGRPILGLDAYHLLDMTLNAHEKGFLVPAHIWTPWFSLLGSKSGFDSMEECFEDLTPYIFAVETGLSSDPSMNRRVSFLDQVTLISNSDAHSPDKLGREANLFDTDLSYDGMLHAMKTGEGFNGTIEFYPEEGKYHLDGHRKCDTRMTPEESLKHDGICPHCGKPLTLGVLYRVNALADRMEKDVDSPPFISLIPLKEMLSEIMQKGPQTKTVTAQYQTAINTLGSEFYILKDCPLETIKTSNIPLLSLAIERLRAGNVHLSGGYDGEFGTVKVFEPSEIDALKGQKSLFKARVRSSKKTTQPPIIAKNSSYITPSHHKILQNKKDSTPSLPKDNISGLNTAQQEAVQFEDRHLMIMAGPGTGKTRTLTHRMASLMDKNITTGDHIIAVTFTHKAAEEMKDRLKQLCKQTLSLPLVATFHALCLHILEQEHSDIKTIRILNETEQDVCLSYAMKNCPNVKTLPSKKHCKKWIESARQKCLSPHDDLTPVTQHSRFSEVYLSYVNFLKQHQALDFEGIIFQTIQLFRHQPEINARWRQQFPYIFVDEYQDVNFSQYTLIRL